MKLAAVCLALSVAGCMAPVELETTRPAGSELGPIWRRVLEPDVEQAEADYFLVDPWSPEQAMCWPGADDVADWRREIEIQPPDPASPLAGSYHTLDSRPAWYLEIHADGRYEWSMPGCTGLSVELGFARAFEDWVVLSSSECRYRREPVSRRVFLLRETALGRVLVEPSSLAAFEAAPIRAAADDLELPEPDPVDGAFYEAVTPESHTADGPDSADVADRHTPGRALPEFSQE